MELTTDRSDVQAHLSTLQVIITRMAQNSASCKTWCVTLISAIVVLAVGKSQLGLIRTALLPLIMFFLLDCYYLSLERAFRNKYDAFVRRLHSGEAKAEELFVVKPDGPRHPPLRDLAIAACSFSIYPFYIILGGAIVLVQCLATGG
jgi:hypothetical protein